MATYTIPDLISRWAKGELTADQAIGHLMQNFLAVVTRQTDLEKRVRVLEALLADYAQQRGLDQEAAVALIVNGFAKEVLQQLPMEFAVEAQKLLGISLEGSVG